MTASLNSKAMRRKLRELTSLAYSRELGAELAKLEADFSTWRNGEVDPFELADRIHRFHNGISRDLYRLYNARGHIGVARAVAIGILDRAELPAEVLEALALSIECFEEECERKGGVDGEE